MTRSTSGMVLLELLLAIAVVSLITTAGFRAFAGLSEILYLRNLEIVESARISDLETRFRRAWDHRLSHRFQSEPWLVIEGSPTGNPDWIVLRELRFKTVGTDGQVLWWESAGASWASIEVNSGAEGKWHPGTAPGTIRFRFPKARSRQNQIGFMVFF